MNMILHDIADADVRNGDTLAEPLHVEGGELMRFDRVITNPPFSQNYTRDGMPFPERFRLSVQARRVKWPPEVFLVDVGGSLDPPDVIVILRRQRCSVTPWGGRRAEREALDRCAGGGAIGCVRAGAQAYLGPRPGVGSRPAT